MTTTEERKARPAWHSWGTVNDDGQLVTFGEVSQARTADYLARHPEKQKPETDTNEANTSSHVAQQIIEQLDEKNILLVRHVVQTIGEERALAFLQETLSVEANGGMMVVSGKRRRTAGGVFFHLVRTKCEGALPVFQPRMNLSNAERNQRNRMNKKKKRAARQAQAQAAQPRQPKKPSTKQKKEVTTTVKLMLIGRPAGKIAEKDGYVALVIQSKKLPTLPKGLPTPATDPTNYVCFISTKQWKNVAQAIEDPEDALVIEGFPQVNTSNRNIKVFVTNVTTRHIQKAKFQKQA